MFRASPWVTYDPNLDATTSTSHSFPHIPAMASEDVEMDAPQISTLREDETPEPDPTPARTTKFRVKLLVGGGKAGSSSSKTQISQPESEDDDEDEDDDDEEDQLIDDDDEEEPEVKVVTPSPAVSAAPSARGTPVKRGAAGRGRGGRKRGAKTGVAVPPAEPASTTAPAASTSAPPAAATKKRGGATGTGRGRGGGRKRGTVAKGGWETRLFNLELQNKRAASSLRDDADSVSEAYAATAASSPMPHDEHSPEPEPATAPVIPPPVLAEMNVDIENVPLPVYPLPSRPFAVQPPPKIGTGFAPVIHVDKIRKPVRRWRQAQREVRGIAGGRWFIKSWLGDKESEYASASQGGAPEIASHGGPPNLVLPKLSGPAISGSISGKATPKGRGSGLKMDTTALGSGFSSRAASAAPTDSISGPPTKKRNLGPLSLPPSDMQVDTPTVSTPNGVS